jgi:hypothetical protein
MYVVRRRGGNWAINLVTIAFVILDDGTNAMMEWSGRTAPARYGAQLWMRGREWQRRSSSSRGAQMCLPSPAPRMRGPLISPLLEPMGGTKIFG